MKLIVIPDETYEKLKKYCKKNLMYESAVVDFLINNNIDNNGNPKSDVMKYVTEYMKPSVYLYEISKRTKNINNIKLINSLKFLLKLRGIDSELYLSYDRKNGYFIPKFIYNELLQMLELDDDFESYDDVIYEFLDSIRRCYKDNIIRKINLKP